MEDLRVLTDFHKRVNLSDAKERHKADIEAVEFKCDVRKEHYEHVLTCGDI
jgi:hypothetical protein